MSKTRSNKAKGRQGQQEVRDMILDTFSSLHKDDVKSNPMGSFGEDILLSPKAREFVPFNIEVKRKKRIGAVRFMEQAEKHGTHRPCVFFREDRGKWYTILEADVFLKLIKLED